MTTYFSFTPSSSSAPTFMPTLDGDLYSIQVRWGLFGQRYYLVCYDLSGTIVFNLPLVETLAGKAIESLSWNVETGLVTATTGSPHGYALGTVLDLVIEGNLPATYNGAYQVSISGPDTFTYAVASDPGSATTFGQASYYVSMTAGYFSSTLIYRNGQFEVNP